MADILDDDVFSCRSTALPSMSICMGNAGEKLRFYSGNMSMFAIVMDGKIILNRIRGRHLKIDAKGILLFPSGSENFVEIIADSTELLLCRFSTEYGFQRSFLDDLKNSCRFSYSGNKCECIYLNDFIFNELRNLRKVHEMKKYSSYFYNLKMDEFFIYLNEYYSKESLFCFFRPLLGRDLEFKSMVYMNCESCRSVRKLAEASQMTVVTFNRHFKKSFGVSATKWLKERRDDDLLNDIRNSPTTFSELAAKYGFSSSAYLTAFCRKNYGATPSELRKAWKNAGPESER